MTTALEVAARLLVVLLVFLTIPLLVGQMEHKAMAHMQGRLGPMVCRVLQERLDRMVRRASGVRPDRGDPKEERGPGARRDRKETREIRGPRDRRDPRERWVRKDCRASKGRKDQAGLKARQG